MDFEKYKSQIDAYMKAKYGGTSTDLMIDADEIQFAQEDGETPIEFVDRLAEKYDWTETQDLTVEQAYKIMEPFMQATE